MTLTQANGVLSVADGGSTTLYPTWDTNLLTITPGGNELVVMDQSGGNINAGLVDVAGTGTITLDVAGGAMTFGSDQGARAGHLTIEASGGAAVTFTAAQNVAGLVVDSGATLTLEADAAVGTVANEGVLAFDSAAALSVSATISGAGALAQIGTGTTTLRGSYAGTGDLAVAAGTLAFAPTATPNAQTIQARSLTIGGTTDNWTARLDLGNSSLVVAAPTVGGGSAAQAQARRIANQIKSGLNGTGLWQGMGITSSVADAYDNMPGNDPLYALGVIQNNAAIGGVGDGTTDDVTTGNELYTSFHTLTVGLNDTLVMFTYFGDADLSGLIDSTDYFLINQGLALGLTGWVNGDFDCNGVIDGTDYSLINLALALQTSTL